MNHNSKSVPMNEERDQNTIDWIDGQQQILPKHLSPIKHPQQDFFIADLFDAISLQLDQVSMEYPLFALKAGDFKKREYNINGMNVVVAPNAVYGLATIHDKDIWIYCISKIMQARREGQETSSTLHFTIYDYLKTTNRGVGGREYELAKASLERLRSTTITTEIETANKREAQGFGLIDKWKIVEEKDGRMIRVSVTLPDWLYRSIECKTLLTISPDYFRLRKPLDRRIYEIARKHCGNNPSWAFSLENLHERTGSTTSKYEFRRAIKSLAESNQLPDYSVEFDGKKNKIAFIKRVDLKVLKSKLKNETIKPVKDNKPKRKRITEYEAGLLASPGEEWPDLLKRIGSEYHVIFDKEKS